MTEDLNSINGMIQFSNPLLPRGFGGAGNASRNAAVRRQENYKQKAPDALYRQTADYEILNSQLNQKKAAVSSQLYSIAKNKYHGDLTAFSADKEVQSLLMGLQVESATIAATRNKIETEKVLFHKQVEDADQKYALSDYAVSDRGRRYFVQNGMMVEEGTRVKGSDSKVYTLEPEDGNDYVTNQQFYQYQRDNMRVRNNKGVVSADSLKTVNHIDHRNSSLNQELLAWGGKAQAGYIDVGSENVISGAGGKSYYAIQKTGYKTNINNLTKMTSSMIRGLSKEAQAELKQEYWNTGYDRIDLYRTKEYVDGKAQKDSVGNDIYSISPIDEADIKAAKAKPASERTEQEKELAMTKALTDNEKFGAYAYNYIYDMYSPLEQTTDKSGLQIRKRTEADSQTRVKKMNFWEGAISLPLDRARNDKDNPDGKLEILRRTNHQDWDEGHLVNSAEYQGEISNVFTQDVDQFHYNEIEKMNNVTRSKFYKEDGVKINDDKFDAVAPIGQSLDYVVVNGIVMPEEFMKDARLFELGNTISVMPKVDNNGTQGSYDWSEKNGSQAYIEGYVLIKKAQGDKYIKNLMVTQNVRQGKEAAVAGVYKAESEWDTGSWGMDLTEAYQTLGWEEVKTTGANYDYVKVPVSIPITETVGLGYSDKGTTSNADMVNDYNQGASRGKEIIKENDNAVANTLINN